MGGGGSVLIIVLDQLDVLFVSLFLMCSKYRIYTNSKSNLYRLKTFQRDPPNWWCACVKLMSGRPIGSQVEQSLALGIRFSAMLVVHFYFLHCCLVHFHFFTSCCIFQFGVLSDNTFQPVFFSQWVALSLKNRFHVIFVCSLSLFNWKNFVHFHFFPNLSTFTFLLKWIWK